MMTGREHLGIKGRETYKAECLLRCSTRLARRVLANEFRRACIEHRWYMHSNKAKKRRMERERIMNFTDRLKRLMNATGTTKEQMAEIFGVDDQTFHAWYIGKCKSPNPDFKQTLLRLESENLPKLSPNLNPETIAAFYAGKQRYMRDAEMQQ
jgi:DNA-binding XRE family transcriptional regulator